MLFFVCCVVCLVAGWGYRHGGETGAGLKMNNKKNTYLNIFQRFAAVGILYRNFWIKS